jgi:hypothetical protein
LISVTYIASARARRLIVGVALGVGSHGDRSKMRRLAFACLCLTLLLSACEQTRDAPTGPDLTSAAVTVTGSCPQFQPSLFPAVLGKTKVMFTDASVQNAASAKIKSISSQCDKNKAGSAQHEALTFVDWMLKKYSTAQLPQGQAVVFADLMTTLFRAVGLDASSIDPGIFGSKGGVGLFPGDGIHDFDLKNGDGTSAIHLDPNAFAEPTLITIIPLPNTDQLVTDGDEQFPPFWDFNATNATGNHTVNGFAIIAFCVDDALQAGIANPQIGHNPLSGGFEVLEPASNEEYNSLGLSCPTQLNDPGFEIGLNFGSGLKSFARSALRLGAHYALPVAERLFMPEPLHAAILGTTGLGGRGSTISPFGEVDATTQPIPTEFGSGDWNYHEFSSSEDVPTGWETNQPLAADGWAVGSAAFGTGSVCPNLAAAATPWTLGTTEQPTIMLLRRNVLIPENTTSAALDILIDNDLQVFVNGIDVGGGLVPHENCADGHLVHLVLQASSGPASSDAPLVSGQINKISIRGEDRGTQSYLDARMTLNPTD